VTWESTMHRAEWRQAMAAASDFIHRNIQGTASDRRDGTQRQHQTSVWLLTQVNLVQMSTHSCLSPWREGINED
jgi:hypothetical protein